MRSLSLACAVKGAREIVIIGHTDCRVRQTTMLQLTDRLRELGIDRARLPENLTEYFGVFASERQNVMRGVEFVRQSPLIGSKLPVHGLLVDLATGKLEWIVNGYQTLDAATSASVAHAATAKPTPGMMPAMAPFNPGEMKFPETKIGDAAFVPDKWLGEVRVIESGSTVTSPKMELPKKEIPIPPPLQPRPFLHKDKRIS